MIGSPDVLAFTSEGSLGLGDGGYLDPQALPEEFSLPLLPPSNPWSSPSAFNRDFVLVAEFSEQVGPIPVKTIPDDPRVIGSFDLNHFSLRIMSVDYQATAPAPQPHPQTAGPSPQPTGPSPQPHPCLAVSEDSCVVLGDSKEGAFAYVHHLTLYDLEARGFVRPFCMAYVSHDQSKIMQHFQELSMLFSRASECLKTGNRRAFANELQRKLQDLEYTRSILQKEVELQTTANQSAEIREDVEPQKTANELANVDRSILDHRSLLRQVTSYPNRKIQDPGFLPYEPSPTSESLPMTPDPPSPSYTPQLVSGVSLGGGGWSAKRFDRRLKPLDELSDAYFLSLTMEQLTNAECRLRGDQSVLHTRRVTHTLSRKLSHTHFLFQLWDQEDNELDEEEGVGLEGGGTADWPGARTPRPESFMSCVEEVSIKLETGEPADVWGQSDCAGVGRWHTEAGMRRGLRSPARRTNSEDSIEVISTTDSIFPDDLIFTAIKEEEPELHSIMGSGVQGKDLDETNAGPHGTLGIEVQEMEENVSERLDTLSPMPQLQDTLVQQGAVEGSSQLDQGFHANGFVRGQGGCGSRRGLVPDLQVNFALPLRLEVKGQGSEERWLHGDNSCNLNVDEASDCISYNSTSPSSSEPPSLPPPHLHGVHSARNPRWRQHQRRKAALEALRFLRQFSFYQNAVFCLLTGRPLVVIGGDERLVRKTVSALSLYLPSPGCYGDAVQPYLATPLQLTDLVIWRLIGIHRTSSPTTPSMLHSLARYRRYLAVLDLDQKTLRSPAYQGHLIGRLADPRALIGHGSTYLLHLESCLMELTAKAFFYTFYTVSLYSSTPDPSPVVAGGGQTPPICKAPPALQCPSIPRGRGSMLTQHCRNFLCGRGFSEEDDFCVLHFLSDLIKQRHTGSGPPPLCFSYSPTPLHRNTTT
ncbi:guanine nucleotide exchange protein smcr8b isoform X2 [Esox lucius]|uniref:guanine nucleotide exchange protein smcr8b isoform X2 n=1 Tax=Esox lucius TaxID=8010 RepID=UPI0010BD0A9E|nr:guanine nucleotide exchange protein smcr8b isoform X2 [Esox lucius]